MREASPIRWWPAAVVLALAAAGLVFAWYGPANSRQDRIVLSLAVASVAAVLLFAWVLLLSRVRWRIRFVVLALVALVAIAASRAVRVRGVSGDILPILEWTWSTPESLPEVAPGGDSLAGLPAAPAPDDYPQFLGPARNGVLGGRAFATDWTTDPPRQVWKQPIGAGWSAFAIVGDLAVTQERRDDEEWVTAYDVESGALRWGRPIGAFWDDPLGGPGPRATPTVADGRVYALGGRGALAALDLATGEVRWTVDVPADAGASPPPYGYAGSPLVVEDAVVVSAGGRDGASVVAYDRNGGARLWAGGSRPAGYSSPVLAEFGGVRQVLLFDEGGPSGYDLRDGRELWHLEWHGRTEHASQPVVFGDGLVYQSSGYGVGGKLFRVAPGADGSWQVEERWASVGLKAKFTNVVHRDGFLYGLDDGILACLDAATGERRWKGGRYGHGQVVLADDVLLVQSERGFVALVEATPETFREIARVEALDGKTWNHPALSGRRLLVRNDREAARIDLPAR